MGTKEKLSLLGKISWDYKDIMQFMNVSAPTAIKFKKEAIEKHNGSVRFMSNLVRADSVLAILGTSREKELSLIQEIAIKEEQLCNNKN